MQSSVTCQEIKNELCLKVIKASRRLAGLSILAQVAAYIHRIFAQMLPTEMSVKFGNFIAKIVADLTICLQKTIRYTYKDKVKIHKDYDSEASEYEEKIFYKNVKCHYLDSVRGCGQHLEQKT
jgi:hypothetical protein